MHSYGYDSAFYFFGEGKCLGTFGYTVHNWEKNSTSGGRHRESLRSQSTRPDQTGQWRMATQEKWHGRHKLEWEPKGKGRCSYNTYDTEPIIWRQKGQKHPQLFSLYSKLMGKWQIRNLKATSAGTQALPQQKGRLLPCKSKSNCQGKEACLGLLKSRP